MKLQIDTDNLYELQIIRNPDNTFGIHYMSITKERHYVKDCVKYSTLERDSADVENVDINCIEIEYEDRILEAVQQDINNLRKQANKEIEHGAKQSIDIQKRLEEDIKLKC